MLLSSLILPLQMAPGLSLVNSKSGGLWLAGGLKHSVSVSSQISPFVTHTQMTSLSLTSNQYFLFPFPHTHTFTINMLRSKRSPHHTHSLSVIPSSQTSIYFEFTELTPCQDFLDQTRYAKRERVKNAHGQVLFVFYTHNKHFCVEGWYEASSQF